MQLHSEFMFLKLLGEIGKNGPPSWDSQWGICHLHLSAITSRGNRKPGFKPLQLKIFNIRECEILRWVGALNHNTEAVLFFLQWESITTVWCTRHSTSGKIVLIDSSLQTLWTRSFPHEGLKPPAQVPTVLCTYTRVRSPSGWISLPSTLFHGNCSRKLNLLMFSWPHRQNYLSRYI